MRTPVDAERLGVLMRHLGAAARQPGRIYFTGGASAVLEGWRDSTIDVDLKMVPEQDELFRAIPRLKDELSINVELASPGDFIPELPGWNARSRAIRTEGALTFCHYDFYAQALAKIERGHAIDIEDVEQMFRRGLLEPSRLLEFLDAIERDLVRYPALDPPSFRRAVQTVVARHGSG
ncbi:MAG: hypothetical protein A3I61_17930 [Acidobacteria bacterium RIFCSPLOWO2_02_FULL_68_18]|nr:MAG: hypothetical protein A3I61_17930 [Acidobacteria bacterium RIFCSPLOWO2_02_FULL_68_18]OFW51495.1 MAG: hypothetical protein A3G77_18380 [Acidobacteria bacterium RIFCSPLOWO2_12_FULL_68_19]